VPQVEAFDAGGREAPWLLHQEVVVPAENDTQHGVSSVENANGLVEQVRVEGPVEV
jgi:hypothetical protein